MGVYPEENREGDEVNVLLVIIVRDVEERFSGGGRSREGVKRGKRTKATLVRESSGRRREAT